MGEVFKRSGKDNASGSVPVTVWITRRRYSPFVWEGGVVRGRLGPPAMKIDRERVKGKIRYRWEVRSAVVTVLKREC